MLKLVFVASALLAFTSTASEARSFRTAVPAPGCNVTMLCDFSTSQLGQSVTQTLHRSGRRSSRVDYGQREVRPVEVANTQTVGGRPSGCPRSFCGCGASLRVFGRIVPELNLAANWLRFVLEAHVQGDTWMAYDANSGGHATRIHARSLRGYTVVNPRAA